MRVLRCDVLRSHVEWSLPVTGGFSPCIPLTPQYSRTDLSNRPIVDNRAAYRDEVRGNGEGVEWLPRADHSEP